jgi:hypothetical protein
MFFRVGLMLLLFSPATGFLQAEPLDEYHVKAAFLYNFAKFIDWPAEAFRSPGDALSICVIGQDPFGAALDNVLAGKEIGGRALAVRRISDARQTAGCQILFVSSSANKRVLPAVAAAKQPGILTVGEAGDVNAERMVIVFSLEGGKVRFEVNLPAAREAGLRISSRLLTLATAVRK